MPRPTIDYSPNPRAMIEAAFSRLENDPSDLKLHQELREASLQYTAAGGQATQEKLACVEGTTGAVAALGAVMGVRHGQCKTDGSSFSGGGSLWGKSARL